MKKKRISLPIIAQVLIAMIVGILAGWFMPAWFIRVFVTFNEFFGQFIGFLVPLIILALVTAAIANTEQNAGRMLSITLAIVFISTIFSGMFSYGVGDVVLPHLIEPDEQIILAPTQGGNYSAYFFIQLPPALDVMTALVLALMLGLGIRSSSAVGLKKGISELQDVVMLSIEKALIPLLPIYIFGIFLHMSATGEAIELIGNFMIVLLIVLLVQFLWILLLYLAAGIMTKRNPLKMMWQMMPAFVFAFGTSSSAATIPITLKGARKLEVSDESANFVIPMCANLHIPGLTIHVVLCAMALMFFVGQPAELPTLIAFVLMLSVTCVATPGIPGGSVAVLPVLATILNFSPQMQAICLSLCIAMDAPITAANVLCDGAVCVMVDKLSLKKKRT
ncbi:MAG: dicarboxylate/amino acid:cation symporter [Paludibacteraceae bacterium]|nr:dicarboxylate/amino acid:cation symporter [Paludibacteraceae bacterium]